MKRYIPKILLIMLLPALITFGLTKYAPLPVFEMQKANAAFSSFRTMMGAAGVVAGDKKSYSFDGTGDYLTIPDHADWQLGGGTGDFTIECWFRRTTSGTNDRICGQAAAAETDAASRIQINAANAVQGLIQDASSVSKQVTSTTTITDTNWHHVAMVRHTSSNTLELFLDGTSEGTVDVTGFTVRNSGEPFVVGRWGSVVADPWLGNLDEFRISNIARWTTAFTPPTSQYISNTNTKLLIHCGETKTGTTGSGATFTDSGNTGHTVTEVGDAIEDTVNYKF